MRKGDLTVPDIPDDGYPERLLIQMLRIYSPSGCEAEISGFLAGELKRLGFDAHIDAAGNVNAHYGSGRPKVLLCGHMDTVKGELEVKKRGKVVFGRGAVDAKSALATLICGAARHASKKGRGSIDVLAVVEEEGNSSGMKHFLERCSENYDYAVFGEPSGAYGLTIGYKGRLLLKVTCRTEAGHASAPQLFENAIYVAMRLLKVLLSKGVEWSRAGGNEIFDVPTICATCISGGIQNNTVPPTCQIVFDIRVPPKCSLKGVKSEVLEAIEAFKSNEKRALIDVAWGDENEPFLEDSESKIVKAFSDAVKEVSGAQCRLLRKTGTGDVNDFVKKFKTSSAVYGPGNSRLDHTAIENVSLEEFQNSIKILEKVLWKLSQKF
jgi:LysW-gamma-L-lysine carboxypeptidase